MDGGRAGDRRITAWARRFDAPGAARGPRFALLAGLALIHAGLVVWLLQPRTVPVRPVTGNATPLKVEFVVLPPPPAMPAAPPPARLQRQIPRSLAPSPSPPSPAAPSRVAPVEADVPPASALEDAWPAAAPEPTPPVPAFHRPGPAASGRRAPASHLPGSDRALAPGIVVRTPPSPAQRVSTAAQFIFGKSQPETCEEISQRLLGATDSVTRDIDLDKLQRRGC